MLARLRSLWRLPERVLELTSLVEHLVEEIEVLEESVTNQRHLSTSNDTLSLSAEEIEAAEKKKIERFREALVGRSPVRSQILARHRAAKLEPFKTDAAPRFKPFE